MKRFDKVTSRHFSAVALIFALLALSPREGSAQLKEMSLEELTTTSSSIVLGRAETLRSFWNDNRTQILTEVRIRVDEPVKGDAMGETVVTIPGGRVGNSIYEVSDMPIFVDGEQVLVFLWEHPSGRQLVTAGAHGKLEVIEDAAAGKRMIRGAALLVGEEDSLGKSVASDDSDVRRSGSVPVDDVIAQIRSYSNE